MTWSAPIEVAKAKVDLLAALDSPAGQQALSFLQRGELPQVGAAPAVDPKIKAALDAVENLVPDRDHFGER